MVEKLRLAVKSFNKLRIDLRLTITKTPNFRDLDHVLQMHRLHIYRNGQ